MNSKPKPIPRISSKKYRGAGDLVASIAQPIAKGIDLLIGTNVAGCGACEKRRKALNRAFPFN